jgi:hypothetical protein
MDTDRYENFKKRFSDNNEIFIDFNDKYDIYKVVEFIKISKYCFKLKDNINSILENRNLRNNQRFCIIIYPSKNEYYIQSYSISTLDNRRDIVLSFTDDKIIIKKILGIYAPNYKPKRIKRTLD